LKRSLASHGTGFLQVGQATTGAVAIQNAQQVR